MPNQFYLNQKVKIKTGNNVIKGAVKDMDNEKKYYLIQTEYGTQLLEPQSKLQPDYDNPARKNF